MSQQEEPIPGNGHRVLMALAWPAAAVLGLVMLLAVCLVALALVTASREGVADLGRLMSQAGSITRLTALIIIVPSIVSLSLLDKVSGAAAIAALSAIAGYVLGGATGGSP